MCVLPRSAATMGADRVPTLSTYRKESEHIEHWGYRAREAMWRPSAKDNVMLHNVKTHLDDREMHAYVLTALEKGIPSKFGPSYFKDSLTVPGHWSARAKDTMRDAAIRAGLVQSTDPP
ncbi:hypothetical protein BGZ96_000875 [Linnemannia gamsii]|uniref:Uncharacterized protein n=1 Tax=Linnemannia gamsii TaxID=64522 RepID=A0ABQ7KAF6_9FUNG|nr:hypothetical protein BGZ96_000875 [Linnemannia gamsii]